MLSAARIVSRHSFTSCAVAAHSARRQLSFAPTISRGCRRSARERSSCRYRPHGRINGAHPDSAGRHALPLRAGWSRDHCGRRQNRKLLATRVQWGGMGDEPCWRGKGMGLVSDRGRKQERREATLTSSDTTATGGIWSNPLEPAGQEKKGSGQRSVSVDVNRHSSRVPLLRTSDDGPSRFFALQSVTRPPPAARPHHVRRALQPFSRSSRPLTSAHWRACRAR